MIEHVYRRVAEASGIANVVIATDDRRIADAVAAFGGLARMTQSTHATGTDRLAEVAADLDCDVIVNVQGDEPLIEPEMLDALIAPLADPAVDITTLRRSASDDAEYLDPNVVKVVVTRTGDALYFSRAPIPHRRSVPADPAAGPFVHVGVYAYRRQVLLELARTPQTPLEISESLEQLRALEHGYRIRTALTRFASIGVDTPEDLERVRQRLAVAARA